MDKRSLSQVYSTRVILLFVSFSVLLALSIFYSEYSFYQQQKKAIQQHSLDKAKAQLKQQYIKLEEYIYAQRRNTFNAISAETKKHLATLTRQIESDYFKSQTDTGVSNEAILHQLEQFLSFFPHYFGLIYFDQQNLQWVLPKSGNKKQPFDNNTLLVQSLANVRGFNVSEVRIVDSQINQSYYLYAVRLQQTEAVVGLLISEQQIIEFWKESLLNHIPDIRFDRQGYFWVMQDNKIIAHPNRLILGMDTEQLDQLIGMSKFEPAMSELRQTNDMFLEYQWFLPKTDVMARKLAYLVNSPDINWRFGAGLYLDYIDKEVSQQQLVMRQKLVRKAKVILAWLLGFLILFVVLAYRLSAQVKHSLGKFEQFLADAKGSNKQLEEDSFYFSEFRHIASHINQMLRHRHKLEQMRLQADYSMQLHAAVFDSTNEGIMITDPEGRIESVNSAFEAITGYMMEEVAGRSAEMLADPSNSRFLYLKFWSELQTHGYWHGEFMNRRKSGELYHQLTTINEICNKEGEVEHYVAVFSDISNRKKMEDVLRKQSILDSLTGLENRRSIDVFLDKEWRAALRNKTVIAAIMLDIDYFKNYNDHYGHLEGDNCLIKVASFLKSCVKRPHDLVGRYGGEEFIILLPNTSVEGAQLLAEKIVVGVRALGIDHETSKCAQTVTVSVGVATLVPDSQTNNVRLIDLADHALYQAKQTGRNRYIIARSDSVQKQSSS